MSVKTETSTGTLGKYMQRKIEEISKESIRWKGESGFFVTKSTLTKLQDTLDDLMEGVTETSLSPTALIELNSQLAALQTRAENAEARLKSSQAQSALLAKDLQAAEDAMKAQDEVTASRVSQIVSEKEPLTKEIVDLRKQVSDLQAKKDHDPEEMAGLRATIKSTQSKLEALNLEKKSLLSSKALLHSQVQALEHALAQEARQAEILAESKLKQDANWAKIAAKQDDQPIQLRDLEKLVNKRDNAESSATKKKIFAPHVLKIVDEYAAKKRESVRESAHALLKLANATDPNNFVGYRDYLRALFESVKNTPHDKRGKYRKLLDSLYDSMVTRTGKKLKEIKVEFRTVFTPTPEEVTGTTQNVASGSFSWWEGVKFDYWLFTRKARLNMKIAKSWFSSKFGGFSSWIRKWSPF